MGTRTLIVVLALGVLAPAFASSNKQDDVGRIQAANQVFKEIMQTPDRGIPREILEGAQCIAIVPAQKNFAFGFGGTYGKGVATCRNGHAWSAPIFIQVGGGSWGLQIGGQSTDVIMVFRKQKGLDSLLTNKVRIGGDASAAAGPVGRQASAATDISANAEILTYSRSRGAFAGVSLNGDVVQPDNTGNSAMYGRRGWESVLHGQTPVPPSARAFLATLNRYSSSAASK